MPDSNSIVGNEFEIIMPLLTIHIEAYDYDEIHPNLMLNFRSGIITSVHVIASYL